ncbi:OPT oligopeptide transporter protein-domain-containing protein [Pisolithus marmoratus]|nr:OPT oligopeptide transporter protein-domain-containing protein [Pisolithus marmoratus]
MASDPEDDQYSHSDPDKEVPVDLKDAEHILENIADFDDPNLDRDHVLEGVLEDDSPYPEVRSAVANTDDPEIPVSTLRAFVMGLFWAILISGLNQFFYFRYPSVNIASYVGQLLSFPMGRAWAKFMPNWRIFGYQLNPGPFTIKEHVLVTIMASVGAVSAYATDVVAVQRVYYDQKYNFGCEPMDDRHVYTDDRLLYGGYPATFPRQSALDDLVWPINLVTCALFNTLHSQVYTGIGNHGGISRERFFIYVWLAGVLWYFVPGYMFQALSYFSWVCWIAPNNIIVNQLFGYVSGLGMSVITFDWAQITYVVNPIATPWWAAANVGTGFAFFFWLVVPCLYYTNTWYSKYLPMSTRTSYDNTGAAYNITRIINADTSFNITAYQEYSPLFLSTTFALSYGLSFASITATLVHALLFFRKQICNQSRRSMHEQADIHARLMSKYKQVPEWWYMLIFVTMFVIGVVSIEFWHTELPVWAFCLSLAVAFVYAIPIGMIQAITNQQIGLNVITELIVGYALPGRPIAMMLFKTWGYTSLYQALVFTSDFKLGHYMKIPPRTMFWCQVIAAMVAGTVQLGVQAWMFSNIPDICSPKQPNGFICPSTEVFGTASFIWGVIGPQRQFSSGQVYHGLVYFFLVGALCPLAAWIVSRKWPNSFIRYVNFPIIFSGTGSIPPASAVNYVPWTVVAFVFNYVIRRRHFSWWTKYNYVLAAALDSGLAVSIVLVFFILQYPANGTIGINNIQKWWGNTVFLDTADGKAMSLLQPPAGGTFGPTHW